jgi:nucleoside-diphosphate-sugar epimerase
MRLLVLGAGGVIGSAVARESVGRGHQVHGLLRANTSAQRLDPCKEAVTCHRCDLEDVVALSALIERVAPQAIVHAAFPAGHARSHEQRLQMLQHGLTGSLSLLDALARARSRAHLVYLGSGISYGATGVPHHPSHRLQPGAFRGVVKAAESLMIGQYGRETGASTAELRLFSVYGPWEQHEKLLPRLFAAALSGRRVPLTAEPRLRDWVYVDDVVDACLRACERSRREERSLTCVLGAFTAITTWHALLSASAGVRSSMLASMPSPTPTAIHDPWESRRSRRRDSSGRRNTTSRAGSRPTGNGRQAKQGDDTCWKRAGARGDVRDREHG